MSFIYNFILFLVAASSIYEFNQSKYVSRTWFYSIIVIMWLTAGLAYAISPDWIPYWNAFEGASSTSFIDLPYLAERIDMELGYLMLNKVISSFGFGYASFLLIFVAISLYLKSSTIYKYSGYVFLSLLLYITPSYFVEEHVHLRQGIATATTIYSIRFIIDRKLYKFLLCIAIAFLFHKSSIIFILAYWIVKINLKPLSIFIYILTAIIINIVGLSNVIDGFVQFLPFGISDTYNDYANAEVEDSLTGIVVKLIIVAVTIIFNKRASENDEYYAYFRNLYLFGVFLYFFFGGGIFAVRLPNYYLIFIIFLIPRMVMAFREDINLKNIIYIGFFAYTMAMYAHFYNVWGDKTGFGNYNSSLNEWVPYYFFDSSKPYYSEYYE